MNADYVAGFVDGEGCFTISISLRKVGYKSVFNVNPRISISTSSASSNNVLERIQTFLKMGKVYYHTRSKRDGIGRIKKETVFRIYRRSELEQFIKLIEDKVIVKRRQLSLFKNALSLAKNSTQNIKEIVQIANELNPSNISPRRWTIQELKKYI